MTRDSRGSIFLHLESFWLWGRKENSEFLTLWKRLQVRAAPSTHQKLGWMIKPAFCLFSLLGISHLFLPVKRALIWRSQDAGVSLSLLWQGWFTEITPFCLVVWLSLLFRCWRPRGNPPIGGCRSSSSHTFSVLLLLSVTADVVLATCFLTDWCNLTTAWNGLGCFLVLGSRQMQIHYWLWSTFGGVRWCRYAVIE